MSSASPQSTAIMLHDVHRVSQDKLYPSRYNTTSLLTVDDFRKALDAITKQYTVISMSDFFEHFKKSGSSRGLPALTPGMSSYCLLTFDNGLLDCSEDLLDRVDESICRRFAREKLLLWGTYAMKSVLKATGLGNIVSIRDFSCRNPHNSQTKPSSQPLFPPKPSLSPIRCGPNAVSRPSRQKQFPRS